jgi:hypothetical protein
LSKLWFSFFSPVCFVQSLSIAHDDAALIHSHSAGKSDLTGFARREADDHVFADGQVPADVQFRKDDRPGAVVFVGAIENEIQFMTGFRLDRRRRETVAVDPDLDRARVRLDDVRRRGERSAKSGKVVVSES